MNPFDLVVGTAYSVTVFIEEDAYFGAIIQRTGERVVEVSLFSDDDDALITADFLLHLVTEQVAHQLNMGRVRELSALAREAILRSGEAEGDNNPPRGDISDIPF